MEKTNNTSIDNIGRTAMPPPPIKPKPMSRTAKYLSNDSPTFPTSAAANETRPSHDLRTFGRFPRGALIWSGGNPEYAPGSGLAVPKLDFSPLGVLSPCMNPSTPLSNLQTPKVGGGQGLSEAIQSQQTSSSSPLINATNSDHKIKRVRFSKKCLALWCSLEVEESERSQNDRWKFSALIRSFDLLDIWQELFWCY